MYNHLVSASCQGERCRMCRAPATHKVGEEILPDDRHPLRHNLTAYVCCTHFRELFGNSAPCAKTDEDLRNEKVGGTE